MSDDVKQLALEVFKGREEAEKRIPKTFAKQIEDYARKILEIFKISNASEESRVLVWQVKLYCDGQSACCYPSISFEQAGNSFYNQTVFEIKGNKLGNNEDLRKHIQNLRIPNIVAKNISKYFKENLSEYFETQEIDNEYIFIKLKRKNDSMNCES